ncbi:MAG: Plastocyanin [Candidatus Daviesbacteria bacterium GW2011_GWA2_38_24]|uniref:Plastocyanin n=1 Tax=Candidatus Daviesbacteria bacterium GW2011_GWA2_38_24 TaxID=1618422 RepID=A0A0G0JS68_9BACT|nr:MAG: Plastocyanin [Candidatus Daviesbacteria bacterium GW2011_GWA2_38_24]KKQ80860.1 MAG: Plastocyanin [Candidatus Daviesbacteria bacterium GW2011_GWA1_38_7]
MNRNAIVAIVLFILVGGVGYYLFQYNQPKNTVPQAFQETQVTISNTKEFAVTGTNFAFDPKDMSVKKGDRVKIIFKNNEGSHDFVIKEFNASTAVIRTGETTTVEFIADKAGTFEFFCSVGDHRQLGMVGKLVVE